MEYKIRKALKDDLTEVYKLVNELKSRKLDKSIFSKKYCENLSAPDMEYWLLELEETIIGFASIQFSRPLHHNSKVIEIQEFVICRSQRQNGFGSKLIDFIIQRFKDQNLELAMNFSRVEAKNFYEKFGFIPTHYKLVYPKKEQHN